MSFVRRGAAAVFAVIVVGAGEGAAQQAAPQPAIPVRALTPAISTDSGVFRSATHVRALSNGSVIVNDRLRRRLVMLDSSLRNLRILADTAPGAPNRYPAQVTGVLPFTGDSSIFVDNESQSLIVLDPSGMFGRIMAPPKASDLSRMVSALSSTGFDAKGRPIYRVPRLSPGGGRGERIAPDGSGRQVITSQPDSAAIVRADFDTRAVDTIMMIKIPVQKMVQVSPQPGMTVGTFAFNPLPQTDEWTLLPDGTIAVVRGQDYHIDWLSPDGKLTSTPKMPFDWKRITQEEKQHLLDSLKAANAKREAEAAANPMSPAGGRGGAGGGGDRIAVERGTVGAGGGPPPPPGAVGGPGTPGMPRMPFATVDITDLPDYYPPIREGQVRSDREGNVWILPSTSTLSQGTILGSATAQTSSLVYDVVGRDGVIKERVKLPAGRNIVAFGPGGLVYMVHAPLPGVIYLERARIARSGASTQ
jgi:hypothetical protein